MIKKRTEFNPKRRILVNPEDVFDLTELAKKIRYGGNPEHKKNPGDFGLSPPSDPRQGKTLCDTAGVFTRKEALELLRTGIKRGLVSVQVRNGLPQNIWSVAVNGVPIEAQLENPEMAVYHAYPLQDIDPFSKIVLELWGKEQ
jgi:hypothetical protein